MTVRDHPAVLACEDNDAPPPPYSTAALPHSNYHDLPKRLMESGYHGVLADSTDGNCKIIELYDPVKEEVKEKKLRKLYGGMRFVWLGALLVVAGFCMLVGGVISKKTFAFLGFMASGIWLGVLTIIAGIFGTTLRCNSCKSKFSIFVSCVIALTGLSFIFCGVFGFSIYHDYMGAGDPHFWKCLFKKRSDMACVSYGAQGYDRHKMILGTTLSGVGNLFTLATCIAIIVLASKVIKPTCRPSRC